jgi:sporulation protein YlmC with PRC-barrel domain
MNYNLLSTSTLTGTGVTNRKGENLGDLKDIMIDLESGEIAYAVISFGGFLGIGDKLFAVPFEALTIDKINEQIVMDVTKEKLENAPGFDKDNWPSSPDRQFVSDVHSHYGYKPYWERRSEYSNVESESRAAGTGYGTGSTGTENLGYGDSGVGNASRGDYRSGNAGLGNSGDRLSPEEGRIGGSRIKDSGFGDRTAGSDPDDAGLQTDRL